jgi:hypothetical protein
MTVEGIAFFIVVYYFGGPEDNHETLKIPDLATQISTCGIQEGKREG